jgi:hypothetical protein
MNSRILPTLALFIAIGIFFAYVNPTWAGPIANAKLAIASDNQALAAATQYKMRQNELSTARDSIDPTNLARLSALLPDSVDNVSLILNINALAARSGVLLSNIDAAASNSGSPLLAGASAGEALPPSTISPIGSVDLSLSAIGPYSGLQAFLTGIEKSARMLDVREISVSGTDTGVYSYHMVIRLYWLR